MQEPLSDIGERPLSPRQTIMAPIWRRPSQILLSFSSEGSGDSTPSLRGAERNVIIALRDSVFLWRPAASSSRIETRLFSTDEALE